MKISAHAIERYRERFNPFLPFRNGEKTIRQIFARSVVIPKESIHKLDLSCDYYLSDNDGTILVAKEDTIVTVYPTAKMKEEVNVDDLNKIYNHINSLRRMLEDYKGHKTKGLQELEDFLNRGRQCSTTIEKNNPK